MAHDPTLRMGCRAAVPSTVKAGARRNNLNWRAALRAAVCQIAILSLFALVIGGPQIIRCYGQAMVARATRERHRLQVQIERCRVGRAAAEARVRLVESPQFLDRLANQLGMRRCTEVAVISPPEATPSNRRCALADVQIR